MASVHVSRWGLLILDAGVSEPRPGCSREQLGPGRREGHEGPGFVRLEPAPACRHSPAPCSPDLAAALRSASLPGKCQFTSYFQCMTAGGKEAKCRENPLYAYARKRPTGH
jgi:hypothetical protein